jgi:Flp pilus assembly protein TadB
MVVAAFIFGIIILFFSFCFLILYVRSHKSMRENHSTLARQRERQLKFQAELQSRMERDTREYEEARQTLLKQAGDDERDRQNIEHAA